MPHDRRRIRPWTTLLAVLVLAWGAGLALAQVDAPQPADPVGTWQGVIGPDVLDLEIRVVLSGTADALTGTLDIPAQGLIGFALGDVSLDGDALHFSMPGVPGDPEFDGVLDGDAITGTFRQGGQELPFSLARAGDEAVASLRPQVPQPPFPYLEEEVSYASGDVTLAGTLTLPPGDGPFPAALLISGSGPQDRNEELLGHQPFLVLADHLSRAGVAVLRVDDRGVGGSGGSDIQASYEDLVGDALAGVAYLVGRPEIDPARVGLIGHSQGGHLAPAAAVASDDVAFVVMIAGPAVDGAAVLRLQNERLIRLAARAEVPPPDEAEVQTRIDAQLAFLAALVPLLEREDYAAARTLVRERITGSVADLPAGQGPTPEQLEQFIQAQVEATVSPIMRAFVTFDPQPLLRQLTVPVLAIYGSLDVQVDAEQSVGFLREALTAAGNPDVSIVTFQGLNHLMQPAVTGNPSEYGSIELTMDPIVLETISAWIVGRFGAR